MRLRTAVLVLTGWTLTACAGSIDGLPVRAGRIPTQCCSPGAEPVEIQYLGVGGWLLRRGDQTVMTAPLYSNPGYGRFAFWNVKPDVELIERFLPAAADNASAILVGHAHYDHLLDAPYIAGRRATSATIYGSTTTVRTVVNSPYLKGAGHPPQSVNSRAGDGTTPGAWIDPDSGGRVRFMALRSDHAPQLWKLNFFEGFQRATLDKPPVFGHRWLGGQTFAYLIDFLDEDGTVAFRVFYQDAAAVPDAGLIPASVLSERPVDVVILCPPSWNNIDDYPDGVIRALQPSHVLLGHWESFFSPQTEGPKVVAALDLPKFLERLERVYDGEWTLPLPGAVVEFR